MDDEFDILNLRAKLQETLGAERRKPPRGVSSGVATPLRGPSLFEWAGIEALAAQVEHDETAPLGPATAWPPLRAVPAGDAHRARAFGRRAEGSDGTSEAGVMHLVHVVGQEGRRSPHGIAAQADIFEGLTAPRSDAGVLARRYVDELPEVPPDPYPEDPADSTQIGRAHV